MESTDFGTHIFRQYNDSYEPVERKFVAWSLALGVVVLWALFAYSRIAG